MGPRRRFRVLVECELYQRYLKTLLRVASRAQLIALSSDETIILIKPKEVNLIHL